MSVLVMCVFACVWVYRVLLHDAFESASPRLQFKYNFAGRFNGQGVDRNVAAALLLFRESAAAGNYQGLFSLAAIEFSALRAVNDSPSLDDLRHVILSLQV